MQKLYLRLNITITTDITLLNYFKDKIKEFYHAILYYLNTDIIYNDLMDYDQSLQFSEFCIDWLIIKTYHNIDCYQQLNALESCMLPKQKAYYYVISEEYVSTKEYLDLTMKAFISMQNSFFLNFLCGVYFLCGYIRGG